MKVKEILEDIKKFHKAGLCKVEHELEKLEETTYSIGDRFLSSCGKKYILSQSMGNQIVMTRLSDGCVWYNPNYVDKIYKITECELKKIMFCMTFTRYWDSQREIYTGEKK